MTFCLQILGSGAALPTPKRYSTAQVLNVLEQFFLIDCGEGTQIQLRRYKVKIGKLNHIFISHLHGDHFLGIFGIISTFNLLGRKQPLHIFAPYRLKELIDVYVSTLDRGLGYSIVFTPLTYDSGLSLLFESKNISVHSFPLRHRVPTCGFLFKEKERLPNLKKDLIQVLDIPIKKLQKIKEGSGFTTDEGEVYSHKQLTISPPTPRSFAFVSDTAKLEKIVPLIAGVDLLYHEATFSDSDKKRAKETGHSTSKQAAEIAKKAKVKQLIIGHFSTRLKSPKPLLEEAKEVFTETYLAEDGKVFNVLQRKS